MTSISSPSLRSRLRTAAESPLGRLVARLGLVLAVYQTVRVVFLLDHRHIFAAIPARDVALAFLHGLRFDLSAIAYSNIPLILLSLAPAALLAKRWYQRTLHALFVAVNGVAMIIMMGDVGYYPFTGTRVTMEVFKLKSEAAAQADQLFVHFAGLTAVGAVLFAALVVLYPRQRVTPVRRPAMRSVGAGFAVLLATAVAARGGLQRKPINPVHAFSSGSHEVAMLTLNSTFTLLQSPSGERLAPVAHFPDEATVDAELTRPWGLAGQSPTPRQNIVVIVLESFGTEFWGAADRAHPELTPFLDSLAQHGRFYTEAYANGRRSMDALPSILMGMPLLMGRSIAVSRYQANEWRGLGHYLGDAGYHTAFFHGAKKGTMYFDALATMAGIADFYPLERFPDSLRTGAWDGNWGIFDEEALQFDLQHVGTFREPWFSMMFLISTHHPYVVPERYRDSLPKGSSPIHQSVAYVDLAVRRFFEAAQREPWYDNTLFILTGDHTAPLRSSRYDTAIGRYLVPILLFHPSGQLPAMDATRIAQHADLFPTILDYAGVRPERLPRFGQSLFATGEGEAVLSADGFFWLVRKDGVMELQPTGRTRSVANELERTGATPMTFADAVARERRLKAYVQHFTNRMVANSFYRDPTEPAARGND